MTRLGIAMLALMLCAATLGCFRTRYTNFTPYGAKTNAVLMRRDAAVNPPSWQSFYVYGWSPEELVIDAGKACGGAAYVESIETRQSFVQGLVAAVAGYYINIYSPYTGAVNCKGTRNRP